MKTTGQFLLVVALGGCFTLPCSTAAQSGSLPLISFATLEKGRSLLMAQDDFVVRLSAFDRSARLKTDQAVSQDEYLRFVGNSVLDWTANEKALVETAWSDLVPRLSQWRLPLPKTIYFVKTNGKEEGDQEYTRGGAIILPQTALDQSRKEALRGTIAHELFHVLSRNAPELRQRLYALIGFLPCEELAFPPALVDRKVTDPDAPKNDHYIQVRAKGVQVLAIPILYANVPHYDVTKGGEFFRYLDFKFLLVSKQSGSNPPSVTYDKLHPDLPAADELGGFFEQVGKNTKYIIHPEEILADNFKFLVLGTSNLPSPEVVQNLSSALK